MKKLTSILLVSVLAVSMIGCSEKQALVLVRDAAVAAQSFERGVVVAYEAGYYSDGQAEVLLGIAKKVAQIDDAAVNAIVNQHDKKGAIANIDQALATIDDTLKSGVLGVKNDAKKAEFEAILLGLRGTLVSAKALLS